MFQCAHACMCLRACALMCFVVLFSCAYFCLFCSVLCYLTLVCAYVRVLLLFYFRVLVSAWFVVKLADLTLVCVFMCACMRARLCVSMVCEFQIHALSVCEVFAIDI